MSKHVTKRRGLVAALGLALTAALGLGTVTAAHAADQPTVNTDGPAVDNITPDTKGSINIHKYAAPEWDVTENPANGDTLTPPDGAEPLGGIAFAYRPITGLDLKNPDDWAFLQELNAQDLYDYAEVSTEGITLPDGVEVGGDASGNAVYETTGSNGTATFSNLPVGVYLVWEDLDNSEPTNADGETVTVTRKSAPFIVTIPFPNPSAEKADSNGWLYNVDVYPKNEVTDKPVKEITANTPTVNVGTDLQYQVTATVPVTAKADQQLAGYRFTDQIDQNLSFKNVVSVTAGGTTLTGTGTTPDYTIAAPTNATGGTLTVTLTAQGLAKLKGGETFTLLFNTTVKSLPGDGESIPNKDYSIDFKNPGDGEGEWKEIPGEDTPEAYFGDYTLLKVSSETEGDQKTALEGAQFQVYTRLSNGRVDATSIVNNEAQTSPLTFTSDADGKVNITGLYYGDDETDSKTYYVVETKQPAGFKEPFYTVRNPLTITINKDSGNEQGDAEVVNEPYGPNDVPNLPLTGAQGKLLLTIGGLVIVGAGVGTVLATRRKKNA